MHRRPNGDNPIENQPAGYRLLSNNPKLFIAIGFLVGVQLTRQPHWIRYVQQHDSELDGAFTLLLNLFLNYFGLRMGMLSTEPEYGMPHRKATALGFVLGMLAGALYYHFAAEPEPLASNQLK